MTTGARAPGSDPRAAGPGGGAPAAAAERRPVPGSLVAEVVGGLRAAGMTIATAESLTGGLLGAALTAVPGASAVYRGGIIAYATDLKHDLLGVDADLLARVGAVDAATAAAMAAGARSRSGADVGIATTGVAGPGPQEGHPPGTVYLGWAGIGGTASLRLALVGTREQIRADTVTAALRFVLERLATAPSRSGAAAATPTRPPTGRG